MRASQMQKAKIRNLYFEEFDGIEKDEEFSALPNAVNVAQRIE